MFFSSVLCWGFTHQINPLWRSLGVPEIFSIRHFEKPQPSPMLRRSRIPISRCQEAAQLSMGKSGDGGKSGDRRDVPRFLNGYATEVKLSCGASDATFFGRPPFRGASGRDICCSNAATNSGLPKGRPVCVERRSRLSSETASASTRNSHHSSTFHLLLQRSISSIGSGLANPQCAAALDHFHPAAFSTMPARNGFNST